MRNTVIYGQMLLLIFQCYSNRSREEAVKNGSKTARTGST
nr:MAG TPA: hypothetical protein [Caudoviricetes sp.]